MNRYFAMLLIILPMLAAGQATAEDITFCVKKNGVVRVPVKPGDQCRKSESPLVIPSERGRKFEYRVGDTGPGGGIIFFVDYDDEYPTFTYLEVASEDLRNEAVDGYKWCHRDIDVPYTETRESTALGRGWENTAAIIKAGCDRPDTAAQAVRNYTGGGRTDWYLPNVVELAVMHESLLRLGLGAVREGEYWTSLQNSDMAWFFYFQGLGGAEHTSKTITKAVLPIRAF